MASRWLYVVEVAPRRGAGDDRAAVVELGDALLVVVADGAGGTSHGGAAAQAAVDAVIRAAPDRPNWPLVLTALDGDRALRGGQTTAVVIALTDGRLVGASVGDSGAWLIHRNTVDDLTSGQRHKPLIGAGCVPWEIDRPGLGDGTLLVASDGLLKYARPADIARLAGGPDLGAAARALVELVRLRSGELPDDVAVALCRSGP